jgi:hypothetical protein
MQIAMTSRMKDKHERQMSAATRELLSGFFPSFLDVSNLMLIFWLDKSPVSYSSSNPFSPRFNYYLN